MKEHFEKLKTSNYYFKDWISFYLLITEIIALRSKDPSSQVGAVIVDSEYGFVSAGYNGFPRGVRDKASELTNEEIEFRYTRENKYKIVVHAEMNAITQAAKRGTPLHGCNLFVSGYPCSTCMGAIIQSGIANVFVKDEPESDFYKRWLDSIEISQIFSNETGINVYPVSPDKYMMPNREILNNILNRFYE